MKAKPGVVEHWSLSGTGMVICGNQTRIAEIVDQLSLPPDCVVSLSRNSYGVGLWGQNLESYLRRYHRESLPLQAKCVEVPV